jgi:hypothetical protein
VQPAPFLGTFRAYERWISLNAGPAGACLRRAAEPEAKRNQRGRSSRRRGIALIAVDTILDVSIKCLQEGRFPMDEVEIPTISGESDLEAALKRMEKEDKSALVVDFREGPRLLFADELCPCFARGVASCRSGTCRQARVPSEYPFPEVQSTFQPHRGSVAALTRVLAARVRNMPSLAFEATRPVSSLLQAIFPGSEALSRRMCSSEKSSRPAWVAA